jgi:hypothetical protein
MPKPRRNLAGSSKLRIANKGKGKKRAFAKTRGQVGLVKLAEQLSKKQGKPIRVQKGK